MGDKEKFISYATDLIDGSDVGGVTFIDKSLIEMVMQREPTEDEVKSIFKELEAKYSVENFAVQVVKGTTGKVLIITKIADVREDGE